MTEEILATLDKNDAALRAAQERIKALEAEVEQVTVDRDYFARSRNEWLDRYVALEIERDAALARADKAEAALRPFAEAETSHSSLPAGVKVEIRVPLDAILAARSLLQLQEAGR